MRGKLGEQVVGTGWKGRMVLRAKVTPANPKTCSQRAHRDHQDKVLKLYQVNIGGDATKKGYWDTDALPRSISGYNLMMMLGRSSRIDCDAEYEPDTDISGHYTVTKDLSTSGLYVEYMADNSFVEVVAIGAMEAGDDVVFVYHAPPATDDEFRFFIVDGRSKTIPPTNADRSSLVNKWDVDTTTTCLVVPAHCVLVV